MRQVNGWRFKRITRGPDRNSYYHELFVRHNPELAWKMSRRSSSAPRSPDADKKEEEPDFSKAAYSENGDASTGIPSQQHPSNSAGGNGYGYHDGHQHLYNGYYDPTNGGAIAPHQYIQSQYLGVEQQPPFRPYVGGAANGEGGNFAEDYPKYPPNYQGPSGLWPTANYPSAMFGHPLGFYTPHGPHAHPVSEEGPTNAYPVPVAQAAWSEEGQHPYAADYASAQTQGTNSVSMVPSQYDSAPDPA